MSEGADSGSGADVYYTTNGSDPTLASTLYAGAFPVAATTTLKYATIDAVGNRGAIGEVTIVIDTGAPTAGTPSVNGASLTIPYGESLRTAPAYTPAPAQYTLNVNGSAVTHTVTGVGVSGSNVVLTIAPAIVAGDTVTIAYASTAPNPVTDLAGNAAATFGATAVTNTTGGGGGGGGGSSPVVTSTGITSRPPDVTSSRTATFAFAGGATFECSVDGGGFSPCTSPVTLTNLAEGTHSFRVRSVGGQEASATWRVDTTPPELTRGEGPAEITVDTGPTFAWSSSETGTAMCSVDGAAPTGCASPKSLLENLSYGPHTFSVYVIDPAGNRGPAVSWEFRVIPPASGDTSSTPVIGEPTAAGRGGSVSTGDGTASLAWTGASTFDGLLMTISQPTGLTVTPATGMTPGAVVDASAFRLSSGEPVHEFGGSYVTVAIDAPEGPHAVYVSSDGGSTWEPIPLITGPDLPADLRHGAFRQGSKILVLTRHLSLFALVGDTQAPSTPVLAGDVRAEGLRLSWQPSQDNSGQVARYVLLVDGAPAQAFGAATTETTVAGFTAADARRFQLVAEDHAGNRSPSSAAVVGVPSLAGLTLDEARAALTARGLAVGAVSEQDSTQPAGTVILQTPAAGAVAAGSTVDVTLARGAAAGAQFVLKVVAAKTVPLKLRRTINVRVQVTRRANVVAVLRSPSNQHLFTWKRKVRAGATVLRLRIPPVVRRTGTYRLAIWAAAVGDRQRVVKRMKIRIVGADDRKLGPKVDPPKKPIEVVLAGGSEGNRKLLNLKSSFRVSPAARIDDAFDRASDREPSARVVVVVDVTIDGVAVIRQFRLVLPEVRVLALARRGQAGAARAAGARAVVSPDAPSRALRDAIGRILDRA
jgi:uncharacterized repeat protein (TIGR02059 family)